MMEMFSLGFQRLSLEDKQNPTHGWSLGTAKSPMQETEGTSFHLPTIHCEIHGISVHLVRPFHLDTIWAVSTKQELRIFTVWWLTAGFPYFWGELIWNENLATLTLHKKAETRQVPNAN